jgi:hypothetical protein
MLISHTVLPFFNTELWFRNARALWTSWLEQRLEEERSLPDFREKVMDVRSLLGRARLFAEDEDVFLAFLRENPNFHGSARLFRRLMYSFAPAFVLDSLPAPMTLGEGLTRYAAMDDGLTMLDGVLIKAEVLMLRMQVFNQLTTPQALKLPGVPEFSEVDRRDLAKVWVQWGIFNSPGFRSVLEQAPTHSNLGASDWSYSNWILFQKVNGAKGDPLRWGKGNNNNILFRQCRFLTRDFDFLTASFEAPVLQECMGASAREAFAALVPYKADGDMAMSRYLDLDSVLSEKRLLGKARGLVPLRVHGLMSVYNAWERDLVRLNLARPAAPRKTVVEDNPGFYLSLRGMFKQRTGDDMIDLGQALMYLMGKRLKQLTAYAEQLESSGLDTRKALEILRVCASEGLVPSLQGFNRRTDQYGNAAFWGSFIGKGQGHVDENELSGILRQLGHYAYSRQLRDELEVVCRDASQVDPLHAAIMEELALVESEVEGMDGMDRASELRVEPVFLSAVLRAAKRVPGLDIASAYCLAFRVNFGTVSGGFSDFTKAYFDEVGHLSGAGRFNASRMAVGDAGVCVSAMAQWKKLVTSSIADASVRNLASRAFLAPFQDEGEKPKALGTLMGAPGFWRNLLDEEKLAALLADYDHGLVSDHLGDRDLREVVKPVFSTYLENVFSVVKSSGVDLAGFQPKLGSLNARSSDFLLKAVKSLSPVFDSISVQLLQDSPLPRMFEQIYRVTDNVVSFQTLDQELPFREAYAMQYSDLVKSVPNLDLASLDLKFEERPKSAGSGNTEFVNWLLRLPPEGGALYQSLTTEGADVGRVFVEELKLMEGAPEALYRRHHALTLLVEAEKQGFLELPPDLRGPLLYLQDCSSVFFKTLAAAKLEVAGGRIFVGPTLEFRKDLASNWSNLGDEVARVFDPEILGSALRKVFKHRVASAVVRMASNQVGDSLGLKGSSGSLAQTTRRYTLIYSLVNHLNDMHNAISQWSVERARDLTLAGYATPSKSSEEVKDFGY